MRGRAPLVHAHQERQDTPIGFDPRYLGSFITRGAVVSLSAQMSSLACDEPPSNRAYEIHPRDKPFGLAPLVYASSTRDGVVLLDLAHNRYVGVGTAEATRLAESIKDWPAPAVNSAPQPPLDSGSIIGDLLSANLIVNGDSTANELPSLHVSLGGDLVSVGEELGSPQAIKFRWVAAFFSACVTAKLHLSMRRMDAIAIGVRRRKHARANYAVPADSSFAIDLVCAFRQFRPFAFAADGHCLFHSLAIVYYLSTFDVFPTWVIGVKTNPWGAHSWVQHGDLLFDTSPEKVCDYSPILAI